MPPRASRLKQLSNNKFAQADPHDGQFNYRNGKVCLSNTLYEMPRQIKFGQFPLPFSTEYLLFAFSI